MATIYDVDAFSAEQAREARRKAMLDAHAFKGMARKCHDVHEAQAWQRKARERLAYAGVCEAQYDSLTALRRIFRGKPDRSDRLRAALAAMGQ